MKNTIYSVWLSLCKGMSRKTKNMLKELYGDCRSVYDAPAAELEQLFDTYPGFSRQDPRMLLRKDLTAAEAACEKCEKEGYGIMTADGENIPQQLTDLADCPLALFYRGDSELVKTPCIAIVGTRRCSPYGRWAASAIGKAVAGAGACVISGMAEGVDTCAHEGALEQGTTAAVLGTGIDICFPSSNKKLYETLTKKQLVLSEYPPGERGYRGNFPERNRIISGISKAVIVIEGALKSGSMITAGFALEQGRDLYAVPGNINQPGSIGVNSLIADGAYPIMSLEELPSLLGFAQAGDERKTASLSFKEKILLQLVRENPGQKADYLGYTGSLPAGETAALLVSLQIKNCITEKNGRYYA